jgi:hypothetical protein
MTEAQLLAALEAEDYEMVQAGLDARPAWLTNDNTLVAYALHRVNRRLLADLQALEATVRADTVACTAEAVAFRATVDTVRAQQAEINGMFAELKALEAELDVREQALDAATAALALAEDDLDIFEAGYQRGYAIGWEHAQREKTP